MDCIMPLIAQYKIILAGAGVAGLLATIACVLLKKLEWITIWNLLYPIGKAFDLFLGLKFKWLEKLVEDIGILGIVPAVISVFAGMTENNNELKVKLKNILSEMSARLEAKSGDPISDVTKTKA